MLSCQRITSGFAERFIWLENGRKISTTRLRNLINFFAIAADEIDFVPDWNDKQTSQRQIEFRFVIF